jgi:hypothetical protein
MTMGRRVRLIWHRLIWHRRRSLRRTLWAMEDALAADAPKLASMFEIFNSLTRYERPVGIEPLASSAPLLLTAVPSARLMARGPSGSRRPRRTRLAAVVALAALAVVAAACFAISTQVRPVPRSCLVAASAGLTGLRLSRVPGCTAYPAQK